MLLIDLIELFTFNRFTRKNLNDFHSGHTLLNKRIKIGDLRTHFFKSYFHFLLKNARRIKNKRKYCKNDQRQLPTFIKHHTCNDKHFKQIAYNHKQPLTENTRNGFNIIYGTSYQSSYSRFIIVLHFEVDHMLKKLGTNIKYHLLSQPVGEVDKKQLKDRFS